MNLIASEINDQTQREEANVGPLGSRGTDPEAFITRALRDARNHAIDDDEICIAVVGGMATIREVEGCWSAGGERLNTLYVRRVVEASYFKRGKLIKLSVYCGVTLRKDVTEPEYIAAGLELASRCADAIRETGGKLRRRLGALQDLGIEIVNGHSNVIDEAMWSAGPESLIEPLEDVVCASCATPIRWFHDAWRHEGGRAEAYDEVPCPRCGGSRDDNGRRCRSCMASPGIRLVLNHVADPEEAGKQ